MKSVLEDLFMGKIDVMESLASKTRPPVPGENAFYDSLSPEYQEVYERVLDSFIQRGALENQGCFIAGFKLAIRLILESTMDTPEKIELNE